MRPIDRHDDVLDQRIDDLAERAADDDADREVDDAALDRKLAELARERHRWPPPPMTCDRGGQTAASPRFAGADAHHLLDRGDEDLAVADLAGARRLDDRLDRALDQRVGDDDLDLDLGQEIDDVFGAAVELGVALLAAESLDLGDRQAGDADFGQRLAHLVELERLDDRFDFFHGGSAAHEAATRGSAR